MDEAEQARLARLRRWVRAHATVAFLLIPPVFTLPLVLVGVTKTTVWWIVLSVWGVFALALGMIIVRVVLRIRREAAAEQQRADHAQIK